MLTEFPTMTIESEVNGKPKQFTLCFNTWAIAVFERERGMGLAEWVNSMQLMGQGVPIRDIVILLLAGLEGGRKRTAQRAVPFSMEHASTVMDGIGNALDMLNKMIPLLTRSLMRVMYGTEKVPGDTESGKEADGADTEATQDPLA